MDFIEVTKLTLPRRVENTLQEQSISFETIESFVCEDIYTAMDDDKGEFRKVIRVVGFTHESEKYLAVLPFTYFLDYKIFSDLMGFEAAVLSSDELDALFKSFEPPSHPPIETLVKAKIIVDSSVLDMEEVYLDSGSAGTFLKLNKVATNLLFNGCDSMPFAKSSEHLFAGKDVDNKNDEVDLRFTPTRLKQRVDETFDLPTMPDIAQDIMKLRVDPSADAAKLAKIVARDPSLAAQVVSWASSPYYGYQGKIDSIDTAIARVLGFELVMNLALGISIGKSLNVPKEGPLGVNEFWRQAIYTANLAEKLCRAMPIKQRPERGLIYLAGLLHNFGHLLLGHIFPPQFKLVNQSILANPHVSVEDIEHYILGVGHEEIGAWLMQNWHMPEELIVAVHRHHQEEFWSKHSVYSNLVLVANRLLKTLDIGDSVMKNIPQTTLELLSLEADDIEKALDELKNESESLDIMAKQLVA